MDEITKEEYDCHISSFKFDVYKKFLNVNDTVYDIGACKGVLTVNFAKIGFNVIAIEGSPINFQILIKNTQKFTNVKLLNVALHEKNESDVITRFNDCNGTLHPHQKINYKTLPQIIEDYKLPNPQFIKMDIEGMESLALKPCIDLILNVRPIFQLSIHDTFDHNYTYVYDNYPGFKKFENGGFDFDEFFKMNYSVFDMDMNCKYQINGFNEYFIIPNEKLV